MWPLREAVDLINAGKGDWRQLSGRGEVGRTLSPASHQAAFSRGPAVHQVFAARLQPAVLASRIGRYCIWTMVSIWRYHKGFIIRGEVPRVFLCGAVCAGWSWSPNDGCGFLWVLWSHAWVTVCARIFFYLSAGDIRCWSNHWSVCIYRQGCSYTTRTEHVWGGLQRLR